MTPPNSTRDGGPSWSTFSPSTSGSATAASIAAPEYAGAIKSAKDKVLAYGEGTADSAKLTEEQLAEIMRALGFTRFYTMYFDGVAVNDRARLSFKEAWERTGNGETVDPEAIMAGAVGVSATTDSPASVADESSAISERMDVVGEKIESKLKGK